MALSDDMPPAPPTPKPPVVDRTVSASTNGASTTSTNESSATSSNEASTTSTNEASTTSTNVTTSKASANSRSTSSSALDALIPDAGLEWDEWDGEEFDHMSEFFAVWKNRAVQSGLDDPNPFEVANFTVANFRRNQHPLIKSSPVVLAVIRALGDNYGKKLLPEYYDENFDVTTPLSKQTSGVIENNLLTARCTFPEVGEILWKHHCKLWPKDGTEIKRQEKHSPDKIAAVLHMRQDKLGPDRESIGDYQSRHTREGWCVPSTKLLCCELLRRDSGLKASIVRHMKKAQVLQMLASHANPLDVDGVPDFQYSKPKSTSSSSSRRNYWDESNHMGRLVNIIINTKDEYLDSKRSCERSELDTNQVRPDRQYWADVAKLWRSKTPDVLVDTYQVNDPNAVVGEDGKTLHWVGVNFEPLSDDTEYFPEESDAELGVRLEEIIRKSLSTMKLCAANYGKSGNGDDDELTYDERLQVVIGGSSDFFKYIRAGATTYFYVLFHTHDLLEFAFALMPVEAQHGSATPTSNASASRPRQTRSKPRSKRSTKRPRLRDYDTNAPCELVSEEENADNEDEHYNEHDDILQDMRDLSNDMRDQIEQSNRKQYQTDCAKAREINVRTYSVTMELLETAVHALVTGTAVQKAFATMKVGTHARTLKLTQSQLNFLLEAAGSDASISVDPAKHKPYPAYRMSPSPSISSSNVVTDDVPDEVIDDVNSLTDRDEAEHSEHSNHEHNNEPDED